PTGIAETPEHGDDREVGYALIDIEELWKRRRWSSVFKEFGVFNAEKQDSGAKAPWRWNDWNDGPTFSGEIFYNPADLVDVHLDGPYQGLMFDSWEFESVFSHEYTYNPYVIKVTVDYYGVWADLDLGKNDWSDGYLKLFMFDGEGECEWWGGWDGVLDRDSGSQNSWVGEDTHGEWIDMHDALSDPWYDEDYQYTYRPRRYWFYGIQYPGKPYFGIESRDSDLGPDAWLMGEITDCEDGTCKFKEKPGTRWYGPPDITYGDYYEEIHDGQTTLDWNGSAAVITLTGEGVDDDTQPPFFWDSKADPSDNVYLSYQGDIVFNVDIFDHSGISIAGFWYKTASTDWTWGGTAYPTSTQYPVPYGWHTFVYRMNRETWLNYQGETILYKWQAYDNDDDRGSINDESGANSTVFTGPTIELHPPTGNSPSTDGKIIAFHTYESEIDVRDPDLNEDWDRADPIIRYVDWSSGALINTKAIGEHALVDGDIIAFQTYEGSFLGINQDLNGDEDKEDIVLRYFNISDGQVTNTTVEIRYDDFSISGNIIAFTSPTNELGYFNLSDRTATYTGLEGYNPSVSGDIIAFETDEYRPNIGYYNISSGQYKEIPWLLPGIGGYQPSISGNIIAFKYWEETMGIQPRNNWIMLYDISTNTVTNTSQRGSFPSIGRALGMTVIAYQKFTDNYYVIQKYTGMTTDTGEYGEYPSVGNIIAFEVSEQAVGEDLNTDGDQDDHVIKYVQISTTFTRLGTAVIAPLANPAAYFKNEVYLHFKKVVSSGTSSIISRATDLPLIAAPPPGESIIGSAIEITTTVEYEGHVEIGIPYKEQQVTSENELKVMWWNRNQMRWENVTTKIDSKNNIAYGNVPCFPALFAIMEWTGVTSPSTVAVGDYSSMDRNLIAFHTYEAEANLDLNGDGDKNDYIIQYHDLTTKTTTNTGHVGMYPSISGNIITFQTNEAWINQDLNLDGDTNDLVIRYYDINKPLEL
ncbi:hypothetical protein DRO54_10625, partial [Candidatus Bathyarchaeota archaeon]